MFIEPRENPFRTIRIVISKKRFFRPTLLLTFMVVDFHFTLFSESTLKYFQFSLKIEHVQKFICRKDDYRKRNYFCGH